MNALASSALIAILVVPAAAAAVLALMPGYRLSARLNVAASLITFVAALALSRVAPSRALPAARRPERGVHRAQHLRRFTTSVFSASYIGHELDTGRLTPVYLRFYHAMYQTLMFAMNLALVANNIGLMWVAIELATLTTVLMVGIYRTPRRSRRPGNTSSWAASASRWRCSAPSSCISRRARWSARAWTRWRGAS